jgi:hypothetical protein
VERRVNMEAAIWTSTMAFVGGGSDAVVAGDGEVFLQLRGRESVVRGSSIRSNAERWRSHRERGRNTVARRFDPNPATGGVLQSPGLGRRR